ncbi:MAG: DUF4250 domain-containing protein [Culicoidibacterales bacterium]
MDALMTFEQLLTTNDAIAMSWLNMKLRDEYSNFSDLCESNGFDQTQITDKMKAYGYIYVENLNQFRPE